jgi:hypothetical protein
MALEEGSFPKVLCALYCTHYAVLTMLYSLCCMLSKGTVWTMHYAPYSHCTHYCFPKVLCALCTMHHTHTVLTIAFQRYCVHYALCTILTLHSLLLSKGRDRYCTHYTDYAVLIILYSLCCTNYAALYCTHYAVCFPKAGMHTILWAWYALVDPERIGTVQYTTLHYSA